MIAADLLAIACTLSFIALLFALFRIDRLEREATMDPMTGLGNRRRWKTLIRRSMRGNGCAVVLFDLANLKAANEVLGHVGADELIEEVGAVIRGETDNAVRLGGDEFAVVMPGATAEAAGIVRDRIEAHFGVRDIGCTSVFISGDVAVCSPGDDMNERLCVADKALEARKLARKLELGIPSNREATLARIAATRD